MSDFLASADRNANSRMESMGVPSAPGDPMAGQGKKPMGDVHYRAAGSSTGGDASPLPGPGQLESNPPGSPAVGPGSEGNCGSCEYFDGQQTCSQVAGNIDPMATCDIFEPKARDAMMGEPSMAGPAGGDEGGGEGPPRRFGA